MAKEDLIKLGSLTARNGFANEDTVVKTFINWKTEILAQKWLVRLGYDLSEIESVSARKLSGHKTDVQVEVRYLPHLNMPVQYVNLQVKLVSNPRGFNQVDKRWLDTYAGMWDIPESVLKTLKHYTGELPPYHQKVKDHRRMFAGELADYEVAELIEWIKSKKEQILSDILRGRGEYQARWMLVVLNLKHASEINWALEPIDRVIDVFGSGEVVVTGRGNICIGRITMQRKGGDSGRRTAQMLQFKINPAILIDKSII